MSEEFITVVVEQAGQAIENADDVAVEELTRYGVRRGIDWAINQTAV